MTRDTPVCLELRPLRPGYTLPAYHSDGAAGLDLAACLPDGPVVLSPGDIAVIPCGFAIAIPAGFEGQVRPRSGLATRHGITLPNSPGTIDSDYRGEACVPLINLGRAPFTIEHGMRVAQLIVAPVTRASIRVVTNLSETARGSAGFGSTGLGAATPNVRPTSTGAALR